VTHEEFDKLVREIERGIGKDRFLLHRHIRRLAVIGYAGLLSGFGAVVFLAALFILPGLLWPKDALGLLILGLFLLALGSVGFARALWVRLPVPEGHPIARADAPALYAMLDQLRASLHSTRFHHVLIVPDCNAAVVQRPRLGVFGWFENYLLLGLPLLENFPADELRAILAHECAHLARSHGRSSQWIYRLRRSWAQIFPNLSKPALRGAVSLRPLITKFVRWFWPRFNAHAFVLSRAHEYEADAAAARLAGANTAATALVRVDLYNRLLQKKFWPDLWRLASREPAPPGDVLLRANSFLAASHSDARQWLQTAFLSTTTNADTHPCLSDRLRSIAVLPDAGQEFSLRATAPPPTSAAVSLLGPALAKVRTAVQEAWLKRCQDQWRQQHIKAGVLQHRLGGIEQATVQNAADADALWDKAQVVFQLEGDQAAASLLRQILALQPRHAPANFALGRILLQSGDAQGEPCLETALAQDEQLLPQAAPILQAYYQRQGRADLIRQLYARLDQFEKSVQASRQERQNVSASDTFLPHELGLEHLQPLRELLASHAEIASASLARKELKYFAAQRLYLLCIQLRPAWHRLPNRAREQAVVAQLVKTVHLPGRVLIFAPRGSYRGIARKLRALPGTAIYKRAG
jgi:Zn-dependent protease with chaperone function